MIIKLPGRQLELKTGLVVAAAAVLLLLGCLTGYILFRDDSDIIVESSAAEAASANAASDAPEGAVRQPETASVTEAAIKTPQIKVYVVGCVNKPGIVTLEKGQLIDDAIRKAGGLTKEADADGINMVYSLSENTMLCIKPADSSNSGQSSAAGAKAGGSTKKEGKNASKASGSSSTAAASVDTADGSAAETAAESAVVGKGITLTSGSGHGVAVMNASGKTDKPAGTAAKSSAININTAGTSELDTLPGIGQATAQDIIAFREKNGPFQKIEDIMKVPRIKQSRFNNIKESICVN